MARRPTLRDADLVSTPVARRLALAGIALAGFAAPQVRAQGITDSDPIDPPGRGRGNSGLTDSDPTDPPGRGQRGRARGTGCTDSDPTDPPGNGRCVSRQPAGAGCSDSDPADPAGQGRGCRAFQPHQQRPLPPQQSPPPRPQPPRQAQPQRGDCPWETCTN